MEENVSQPLVRKAFRNAFFPILPLTCLRLNHEATHGGPASGVSTGLSLGHEDQLQAA